MPVELLLPATYPAIRAAIRVDIDASDIPDAVIGLDLYVGAAERQLLALDPNAYSYAAGSDQQNNTINAGIYLAAARLAEALPNITSESYGGSGSNYRYNIAGWDGNARAAWLRWQALQTVADNTGQDINAMLGGFPSLVLADAGPPGAERGAFPSLGQQPDLAGGALGWW